MYVNKFDQYRNNIHMIKEELVFNFITIYPFKIWLGYEISHVNLKYRELLVNLD